MEAHGVRKLNRDGARGFVGKERVEGVQERTRTASSLPIS